MPTVVTPLLYPRGMRRRSLSPCRRDFTSPSRNAFEFFAVTPRQSVFRKDYVVRRRTVWTFRLTLGAKQEPVKAAAVWEYPTNRPGTNDNGLADPDSA